MTYAYDKLYLSDAQSNLAAMLDYAVYSLKYELNFFFDMFLQSSVSKKFADGDFSVIAGKSGVELARVIVEENTNKECTVPYESTLQKSPEYWTGWALAYYQWYSGVDFSVIASEVSINDICMMYSKYHEMDISHFIERMNELRMQFRCMTYLKKMRQNAGLSQRELANQTGIPINTIQQYEQSQKNINKAQAEYIIRLSRALACRPEDLLENSYLDNNIDKGNN